MRSVGLLASILVGCSTTGASSSAEIRNRSCDETDAATTCAPPAGHCVFGKILVYYTAPTCESGTCKWHEKNYTCTYSCAEFNGVGYCRDKGFTAPGPREPGDYFF